MYIRASPCARAGLDGPGDESRQVAGVVRVSSGGSGVRVGDNMSDHGFALWGCSPVVLVILFYGLDMFGMIVDRTRRSTIVVIHRI